MQEEEEDDTEELHNVEHFAVVISGTS